MYGLSAGTRKKVALCRKVPVIEGWTVVWFFFFVLTNLFQNHIILCLCNRLRDFESILFSFEGFRNQDFNVNSNYDDVDASIRESLF